MIADRYLERRFREGFIVGFKEGYAEGFKEGYTEGIRESYAEQFKKGYAEGRAEQCRRIRQILDHTPTELTPEMRDGLARALAEMENAPIPAYSGHHCGRPGI